MKTKLIILAYVSSMIVIVGCIIVIHSANTLEREYFKDNSTPPTSDKVDYTCLVHGGNQPLGWREQ